MIEQVMTQFGAQKLKMSGGLRRQQPPPHDDRKTDDSGLGGAAAPPIMFEEVMIQIAVQGCNDSKKGAIECKKAAGGVASPMMVDQVHTYRHT